MPDVKKTLKHAMIVGQKPASETAPKTIAVFKGEARAVINECDKATWVSNGWALEAPKPKQKKHEEPPKE